MSLKGYQWFNDKNEVLMSYYFKDLTLYIWKDVTNEELEEFKKYLKDKHNEVIHVKDCKNFGA